MTSRRQVLRLIGGSTAAIAAIGAGGAAFVVTRDPVAAQRPWIDAVRGGFGEPRLDALAWAILAPNPHNRQPWLFELAGDDQIIVHCDLARRLPQTDPFDRQIVIGFGCMLELLSMAAAEQGHYAQIELFPEGEPQPRLDGRAIAHVRLEAGGQADPLFTYARTRRSNKEVFDTSRPVSAEVLSDLVRRAVPLLRTGLVADPAGVAALRALTWRAMEAELTTADALNESIELMRIGRAEIEANPGGIALSGAAIELMNRAGLVTRKSLSDPRSPAFRQTLTLYESLTHSAMAHIALVSPGNARAEQIRAGRDWLRLNLAATASGLGLHPLSQALQEFPEMAAHYKEAHARLAPDGGTVQMLGRLGYGPQTAPTRAGRWKQGL